MPGDGLPLYVCRRCAPFAVDGDLSKPVWQEAEALTLTLGDGSGAPQQVTQVRGRWDGAVLYLAYDCADSDIYATMTQRDDKVWQEEAVEAFIAPYGDLLHYFELQCNALNTVRDIRVTNHNTRGENPLYDGSWDCPGWRTAVRVERQTGRWTSEWAVPLAELLDAGSGPVLAGEEWRINVQRIDRRPRVEYTAWSTNSLQPFTFHRPRYFGRWRFE